MSGAEMDDDWGDQERRECPRCQGESAFDGEPRCAMCRSRGYVIGATLAEIQAADAEVAALGAETLRPEAPDCAAWPKCGREVRGHCACDVDTVPVPRPDPEAALLAAMEREAAATSERLRAAAQCSPAQQVRALCRFRRQRGWCVDCGNAALAGAPRCMGCELAAIQG